MAKIDTLKDNFNDNSFDTAKWEKFELNSTFAENNGVLTFNLTANSEDGSSSGWTSITTNYDFVGSSCFVQVLQAASGDIYSGVSLAVWNDNPVVIVIGGGEIYAIYGDGPSSVLVDYDTYNPSLHKWLRIRESSGTVYWETSANGISWNVLASASKATVEAVTGSLGSVYTEIFAGSFSTTNPTNAIIDNFNCPPRLLSLTGVGK